MRNQGAIKGQFQGHRPLGVQSRIGGRPFVRRENKSFNRLHHIKPDNKR